MVYSIFIIFMKYKKTSSDEVMYQDQALECACDNFDDKAGS